MGNKKSSVQDPVHVYSSNAEETEYNDIETEFDRQMLRNLAARASKGRIQRSATFNPMIVQTKVSSETMNYHKSDKLALCLKRWTRFCQTIANNMNVSRFCFEFEYDELMNQRDHDFIYMMMLLSFGMNQNMGRTLNSNDVNSNDVNSNAIPKILPYEVADIIVNHVGRYWFFHKLFVFNVLPNINAFKSMNVSFIFADYIWFTKVFDEIMIFKQGNERQTKSDIVSYHNKVKISNEIFQYTLLLIPPTMYSEYEGG